MHRFAVALIVLAELFGTSLWFSANAAADALMQQWRLQPAAIGELTSAVQLGFITATFLISVSGVADRFAASRIFCVSALFGAMANSALVWWATDLSSAWVCRFATGVCLAGIYPLGMKLVVSWAPARAGQTLAWLVGMLTLGTATPHALRALGADVSWALPVLAASGAAVVGGGLVLWVGDGPHLSRKPAPGAGQFAGVWSVFRIPEFRRAALGYFGHMWELYAFWTVVPFLLASAMVDPSAGKTSGWAFSVIAIGALGCVLGGRLARSVGGGPVAAVALLGSGLCCLVYPWLHGGALSGALMLLWGALVITDSPQFSALSARACPAERVGAALAVQNSIGFLLSVGSITLVTAFHSELGPRVAWLLLPGPVLGLLGMGRLGVERPRG